MQGHRTTLGSSTGTIEFEHGASPRNGVISTEILWNDRLLPEILPTAGTTVVTHYGSAGAGGQNLSLWNQGEASSSSMQNAAGCSEQKSENGWPSGSLSSGTVTGFEEWFNAPAYLSQDSNNSNLAGNHIVNRPLTLRSSSTEASHQTQLTSSVNAGSQNLNLNVRVSGQSIDHSQFLEPHNSYRSSFSGSGQMPAGSAIHSFVAPGNGSHLVGDNPMRFDNSHDACRLPCKRKIMDEDIGQSSASGSSGSYQHAEGSSWHPIPLDSSDNGLNIAGSHGQLHPMYGLSSRGVVSESLPDVSQVDNGRNNTRNLRLRLSSSVQPSAPLNIGSTGSSFTPSNDGGLEQPSVSVPPPLMPFMAPPDGPSQQTHPAAPLVVLPRNAQPFRQRRGLGSRSANSSGVIIGDGVEAQHAEATLRMSRQLLERHMRAHQLIQVPISRNMSASRGNGNALAINPPDSAPAPAPIPVPVPSLGSDPNPSANTPVGRTWGPGHSFSSGQRIAEIARRSAVMTGGPDHAGASNNQSLPMPGAPAPSRQMMSVSGANGQGNQLAHRRLALLMQRRGSGLPSIPYSLQSLGAAGDDRSRLITEIWSALDSVRRGEPLRPEDMMILDQSGLFGMAAELHDRHRDMRLDVDNMSYEELLALEERIGNVNTGLTEEAVIKSLKQHKFAPVAPPSEEETEPCCICQEEYNEGEDLGILDCGHYFHTVCVKQWLVVKNLCPICKTTGLASK